MAAVAPEPSPDSQGQVLSSILAARTELDGAVSKAALTGDPIRYLLAACSAALGAFGSGIQAIQQPLDSDSFEKAVRRLEQSAARGADLRTAALVRAHWRRTLLIYGLAFVGCVAAAGLGGYFWGRRSANLEVQQTEQQIALAFQAGPAAAASWSSLMRSNNPEMALAGCTGPALKVIDGRRACNVPLWLDPPTMAAPGGK